MLIGVSVLVFTAIGLKGSLLVSPGHLATGTPRDGLIPSSISLSQAGISAGAITNTSCVLYFSSTGLWEGAYHDYYEWGVWEERNESNSRTGTVYSGNSVNITGLKPATSYKASVVQTFHSTGSGYYYVWNSYSDTITFSTNGPEIPLINIITPIAIIAAVVAIIGIAVAIKHKRRKIDACHTLFPDKKAT